MPSGFLVDSLQPDEEVSRVWLCCGKEWGLQQDELHSLWDLLLLAVWSEDWRVRGVMERSDGSGGKDGWNEAFLLVLQPSRYAHFDSSPQCRLFRDEDYQPPQATRNITEEYDFDDPGLLEVLLHPKCPQCQVVSDSVNRSSEIL